MITYAYEAREGIVNLYRLAGFPPDLLITVPNAACHTLDFQRRRPDDQPRRELTTGRARSVRSNDRCQPQFAELDSANWRIVCVSSDGHTATPRGIANKIWVTTRRE